MLLARAGLRVLVVDRSRYGADTLSTHALMRGGVLQLHRWGLLDRIVAAGTPPVRRTTFRYGDEEVVITIKPVARRRRAVRAAAHRARPDPRRRRRCGRRRGPLRRHRHRPALAIATAGSRASTAATTPADRSPSTPRSSSAPTALRSTVAGRVGAPIERAGTGASAVVYGYWAGLEHRRLRVDLPPGRLRRRHPDQRRRWPASSPRRTPARIGRGGRRRPRACSPRRRPTPRTACAAGTAPPGVRTFMGHPGFIRRSWGPGWALVGDAGYWKDPLSAHGLTDALPRRRAAGPGDHRRRRPPTSRSPSPWPATRSTRDQLSRPTVRRHRRHRRPAVVRRRDRRAAAPAQRRDGRRGRRHRRPRRRADGRRVGPTPPAGPEREQRGSGRARAGTPATPGRARAAGGCSCRAGAAGCPG